MTEPKGGAGKPGQILKDIRPKYKVLQDLIREGIADGTLTTENKLPSEQDMARHFGVAFMTVRAALNEMVADGTLLRIHGKGTFVRQDTPVTSTSSGILAFVLPSLDVLWSVSGLYYYPSILQGFCATATKLGYEPTVIGRTHDALSSASGELTNVAGAACIMISHGDEESLAVLRNRHVPVVGINHYLGRRSISYVSIDQSIGMLEVMRLLADQGHQRIAFLPGLEGNLSAEERQRGFQQATQSFGLSDAFVWHEGPADYSDLSGVLRTRALLSQKNPPTAIVTAGDLIAAGVLQAAKEIGLSVPDDLSVVGYGDFEIAAYLQPGLTTVHLPLRELGARAAELLSTQIAGQSRQQIVTLKTNVVERSSVAAVRS